MTKYKVDQAKKDIRGSLWLLFVIAILIVITLWGVDMIEYVSTNNILKGQF